MKLIDIFTQFTLIVIVKGTWFLAALQPVILTLGTVFTALDTGVLDVQPIEMKKWLPFVNKVSRKEQEEWEEYD